MNEGNVFDFVLTHKNLTPVIFNFGRVFIRRFYPFNLCETCPDLNWVSMNMIYEALQSSNSRESTWS